MKILPKPSLVVKNDFPGSYQPENDLDILQSLVNLTLERILAHTPNFKDNKLRLRVIEVLKVKISKARTEKSKAYWTSYLRDLEKPRWAKEEDLIPLENLLNHS